MVIAAASAHELYGWHAATLPTNLVVEAEALGAQIDFRGDMPEPMWPLVAEPLFLTPNEVQIPRGDFIQRGQIPLVLDALRELKIRVGNEAVIGASVPGPFTLAVQVVDYNALLPAVKHSPHEVAHALDAFTEILIPVAQAYQNAGADFITIHEMGGSPGVLGPRAFGELVLPRLQRITAAISAPKILSVCGNTNNAMELLGKAGAEAVNVDQTNNLARSREILDKNILLFGNLDPVGVIARGTPETIRREIERVIAAGADAVMPGCDLFLQTPAENFRALGGE
jgi:[methyl-Co(III) methanol-specific corrinoid protein]:coenzyme M methyltransferase